MRHRTICLISGPFIVLVYSSRENQHNTEAYEHDLHNADTSSGVLLSSVLNDPDLLFSMTIGCFQKPSTFGGNNYHFDQMNDFCQSRDSEATFSGVIDKCITFKYDTISNIYNALKR